jgi:hypothetical protein
MSAAGCAVLTGPLHNVGDNAGACCLAGKPWRAADVRDGGVGITLALPGLDWFWKLSPTTSRPGPA